MSEHIMDCHLKDQVNEKNIVLCFEYDLNLHPTMGSLM